MSLKITIGGREDRFNSNDLIEIFLIGLMFVIKVTPQLQYSFTGLAWSFLYHVVFGLWFLITLYRSPNWILGTKELQSVFLWLCYLFLTFLVFDHTQWGYFSLLLSFWEPVIIFYYYTQFDNHSRKREFIAWIAVFALAYGLLNSIQTIDANELAAREASSGHSSQDAVLTGNYSFTATITILLGSMLCYLQTHKFMKHKIKCALALFMVIGAVVFVFQCNLMISILSIIVAAIVYVAVNKKKEIRAARIILLIVAIAILIPLLSVIGGLLADLIDSLGDFIGSSTITDRTSLLSAWLRGGSMEGNLESRINLCRIALNTFINNPIFGIGPQNNASIYFETQLGLHATFFDEWARFGLVGMILLIRPFLRFYRYVCSIVKEGARLKAVKAGFWVFLFISMLNPVASANVGIALFYIVPVIALEKQY